jgi:hypothetical protein
MLDLGRRNLVPTCSQVGGAGYFPYGHRADRRRLRNQLTRAGSESQGSGPQVAPRGQGQRGGKQDLDPSVGPGAFSRGLVPWNAFGAKYPTGGRARKDRSICCPFAHIPYR